MIISNIGPSIYKAIFNQLLFCTSKLSVSFTTSSVESISLSSGLTSSLVITDSFSSVLTSSLVITGSFSSVLTFSLVVTGSFNSVLTFSLVITGSFSLGLLSSIDAFCLTTLFALASIITSTWSFLVLFFVFSIIPL